jgi:hypothetical protein
MSNDPRGRSIRRTAGSVPGTVSMSVTAHDIDDAALQAYASGVRSGTPGWKLADLRRKARNGVVTISHPYGGETTHVIIRWNFKPTDPVALSRLMSERGLR